MILLTGISADIEYSCLQFRPHLFLKLLRLEPYPSTPYKELLIFTCNMFALLNTFVFYFGIPQIPE